MPGWATPRPATGRRGARSPRRHCGSRVAPECSARPSTGDEAWRLAFCYLLRVRIFWQGAIMTMRFVLAVAVVLAAATSTGSQTLSPEDSLKATHETLMRAVTTVNAERVAALIHPRALGFFRMSQQVAELEGKSALAVFVETLLKDLGEFAVPTSQQSLSTRLRVAGDTGIVTQTLLRESVIEKKKIVRYLRSTAVYVRSADGWKLISWHTSDSPLAK